LKALGEKREIISVACPEFVPLIEEGKKSFDAEIQKAVETALSGIKEKAPCALILGCTHYGIIEKAISDFLGNDITIISASVCAAEAAAEKLQSAGLLSNRKNGGNVSFITSGKKSVFECLGSTLLGFEIDGYVTEISPAEV
jgi:glutamate racemase